MNGSINMRTFLDLVSLNEEEINEILGLKTASTVAKAVGAVAGVPGAKKSFERAKKIDGIATRMGELWKKFISGKHNIEGYKGRVLDPKDPKTARTFFQLMGFETDDIDNFMAPALISDSRFNETELLSEFLGSGIKKLFAKAAKYAVDKGIRLGQRRTDISSTNPSPSSGSLPSPGGSSSSAGVGLDALDSSVVTLMKKVSSDAASKLELKLVDGFDVKASAIAPLINGNSDDAVHQLALVGFAYLRSKIKDKQPSGSAGSPVPAPPAGDEHTDL